VKRRSASPTVSDQRGALIAREMRSVLKVGEDFYILASSIASRRKHRVLANAHSFAVFDVGGDILESPLEAFGFFHSDTRYLSRFELRIDGKVPYFLNSYLREDKALLRINMTNPDLSEAGNNITLARDSIQIERSWVVREANLCHRLRVYNYAGGAVVIPLEFLLGVDFADIFEARGVKRSRHGKFFKPDEVDDAVKFSYRGLDGIKRFTEVSFSLAPRTLSGERAAFLIGLEPGQSVGLDVRITAGNEREPGLRNHPLNYGSALAERHGEIVATKAQWAGISASSPLLDALLRRSMADLTSISRTHAKAPS
jgi:glycogen debranching enzyme